MFKKSLVLCSVAGALFAATPSFAQLACDPDQDVCDDDGGLGGGGLGGLGSGGTVPGKGGTVTPSLPAAPSASTTINFNSVGQTLGSYTESGYNFTTLSGSILGGYGAYGSRGIGVLGPLAAAYDPVAPANIFELTRADGGLFSVDSFFSVVAGPPGTNTVGLQGFLNNTQLGSSSVNQTDVFGFGYPQSSGLTGAFDRVRFTLSTTSSSSSFDNLALTAVASPTGAVPEPATWLMMLAGFGAVGFAMRTGMQRSSRKFDEKITRITAGAFA